MIGPSWLRVWPAIGTAALLTGLASCSGTPEPKTPGAYDTTRGSLVLETLAETREGTALYVSEGDTLSTGDKLWFRVRTDGPAYIYVIQIFPDGSAGLLYPERGDVLLRAGTAQRVPSDPHQHFVLDDTPGLEHVLLIASRISLDEADSRLADLVEIVRSRRKWPTEIPLGAGGTDASAAEAAPPQGKEDGAAPHDRPQAAPADVSANGDSAPRHHPRHATQLGARRPASAPSRSEAQPDGFLNLLGSTRSLERGLRLETHAPQLHVVPDDAGIAVSLLRFHHRP